MVSSATRRPIRAAASAASHPACPAPTTTTSYGGLLTHVPSPFWRGELFSLGHPKTLPGPVRTPYRVPAVCFFGKIASS